MLTHYLKTAANNGNEMASRILEKDWNTSSLGDISEWTRSLQSAVSICIGSNFPVCIYWGKDLILIYNDSWSKIPAQKHPWALGKKAKEVWPELWDRIGPLFTDVFNGLASKTENDLPYMQQINSLEETHFDYTFSPIIDDHGKVGGIFNAGIETTNHVIAERRTNFLDNLFNNIYLENSVEVVSEKATEILKTLPQDLPFFILFIKVNEMPYVISSAWINPTGLNLSIDLLPFKKVDEGLEAEVITIPSQLYDTIIPFYKEKPTQGLLLPILNQNKSIEGYLFTGLNSRCPFNARYRNFLNSVASHISLAFSNIKAQEEKTKSINQMRGIFNHSPVAITLMKGPEYIIEIANERILEIWGRTAKEVIGKPVFEIFPELIGTRFENIFKIVYYKGERFYANDYHIPIVRNGKHEDVYINFVYEPLKESDGSVSAIIAVALDITEAVKAKKAAQENSEQLQKLMFQKDEFMSIASHELKTPITSIKGYIQLSKRILNPGDKSYSFIDKASVQIERLQKLVSDLLDVTKINAGKIIYDNTSFNFGEALTEGVDTVQQLTDTHHIICNNIVDVNYNGDRARIEQVIINFLTNAIKYSPDADKIIVNSEIKQNNIVVSIEDFGIGIEYEHLHKLFERFYRVENTSSKFQGLGLGLYIASEILKCHQGSFWIESIPGKGSTFYFVLPLDPHNEQPKILEDATYYADNNIKIMYNKEKNQLEADWTGFQNFKSVQNGCMLVLEMFKKNQCTKLLNDHTNVLGNWSEASDWVRLKWLPLMEEAGLKYFAWILSPDIFSSLAGIKSVDESYKGVIKSKFFKNINEAHQWINTIDKEDQ